jgi:hypothetical protein
MSGFAFANREEVFAVLSSWPRGAGLERSTHHLWHRLMSVS